MHSGAVGPAIRAASLRGFVPLVEELGGDPHRLLARFGIPADAPESEDAWVPITEHDLMLDAAAVELRCPDLGLRLAETQDLTILGSLAVAIQACPTAAEALVTGSRYLYAHSPALRLAVESDPYGRQGVVALTYRKDLRESSYSAQATELGLGLFFRIASTLVGNLSGLRSVDLPHRPLSPVRRYTDYFGADVRFGRTTAALRIDRRVLDKAFATANESIRLLALDHLSRRYDDPAQHVSTQVRGALAEALGTSPPSVAAVARLLALHPRTLQRRLAAEGTSFEAVLDEVRRDATRRHLTTTTLPLAQVATLVGFAEQSTLSHAVRRWFGCTPRELRRDEAGTALTLSR